MPDAMTITAAKTLNVKKNLVVPNLIVRMVEEGIVGAKKKELGAGKTQGSV